MRAKPYKWVLLPRQHARGGMGIRRFWDDGGVIPREVCAKTPTDGATTVAAADDELQVQI